MITKALLDRDSEKPVKGDEVDYPNDAALFEVDRSPFLSGKLTGAEELKKDQVQLVFDPQSGKLRSNFTCWSESYGPGPLDKPKEEQFFPYSDGLPHFANFTLHSAPVEPLEFKKGLFRYRMPLTITEEICYSCFRQEPGEGISSNFQTYNIVEALQVKVMTVKGDSGSPLYCREKDQPKSPTYLVGTLGGLLSRVGERDADPESQTRNIHLGSYWIPLQDEKLLTVPTKFRL